ncbi:MAG: desulfoferrodoxin family protein [Sphaerochaeta sp.]|uniref:desulfoferrodoxin family protein n=1 Tax=Sphaerochaeta sp. TaxID=1972642 RepID=UPI002FC8C2BA
MAKKLALYRCPVCHSLSELIDSGNHTFSCCGQPMQQLSVKSDAETDVYHLPVLTHRNGLLYVEVGSKPHPQSEEHHISCIFFVTKQTVRRSDIRKESPATAVFTDKEHGDVYAYCNVHGLFKTSF